MDAATLIALEGTFAKLGELYEIARQFTRLAERAEHELLPAIEALGARVRRALRRSNLTPTEVEATARKVVELRAEWQQAIAGVRQTPEYETARKLLSASDEGTAALLVAVIPQVFAGLHTDAPATELYFPVSVSTGRRRPGLTPFVSASECAARLLEQIHNGLQAEAATGNWWEEDLPYLLGADDPEAFDTPVALTLLSSDYPLAAFRIGDEPFIRVFTRCLRGNFAATIASTTTDQWWETHDQPYPAFRDSLTAALTTAGLTVRLGDC